MEVATLLSLLVSSLSMTVFVGKTSPPIPAQGEANGFPSSKINNFLVRELT